MTEDGSRRRPGAADYTLEAEVLRLAAAVGLCTARARLDMPALPALAVRRCVDAAAVLDHATRLLLHTLTLEEVAADKRQGACLDCGAPLPRPEAWGYCDGCGPSTGASAPRRSTTPTTASRARSPDVTPPRDPDDDEFVPPDPCPACRGSGRGPGGPGEDDTVECPLCGGTGVE